MYRNVLKLSNCGVHLFLDLVRDVVGFFNRKCGVDDCVEGDVQFAARTNCGHFMYMPHIFDFGELFHELFQARFTLLLAQCV